MSTNLQPTSDKFSRRGPQSKRIIPEIPDVEISPIFNSRLEHINRAFAKYNIDYFPSSYVESRENRSEQMNQQFMKQYQNSYEISLISLKRVLLKPNQFVNENGEIKNNIKSALVVKLICNVYEPEGYKMGAKDLLKDEEGLPLVGAQHVFEIGVFRSPVPRPVMDRRTYPYRIIEYEVAGYEWRFYLEDSPKMIESLIKKWGEPSKVLTVSTANTQGESPFSDSRSIYSFQDWVSTPIPELIQMNLSNGEHKLMKKGDTSSVIEKFRTFQKRKAHLVAQGHNQILPINPETEEFLRTNNISVDSLVSQLRLNTVSNKQVETTQHQQTKARRKPSR